MDPIYILGFLKKLRDACDSVGMHEVVATWLFSCIVRKPAFSSLQASLYPKKRHPKFHDKRLSSYVEVVNYLLVPYTPDDIIARAIMELEVWKQFPAISAAIYAKKLYAKALRCGIVYEEKRVNALFVEDQTSRFASIGMCIWDSIRPRRSRSWHGMLTH